MDKKSVIVIVITAIILIMATVLFAAVGCSQEVSGNTTVTVSASASE